MSGLPDYEPHNTYSESDVEHIIARRMGAIQLQQLQDGQLELRREMLKEVEEIKASIAELVAAWQTAGNVVRIVKWLAGAVAAVTILIAAVKGFGR